TQTSSPSVSPTPPELTSELDHASRSDMVIPNRIFVGGIDLRADKLCFHDQRLNIGQAIRRQQVAMHSGGYSVASPSADVAFPAPFGTKYLTTPTGYAYTYHNGVAYFHNPEPNIHPSHWPASHTAPGSPVMVAHSNPPFYTPQACHQHQDQKFQPMRRGFSHSAIHLRP
ncbi:hypothetical protein QTP86_026842, partial [Hemibagrus guttatus]